MYRRELEKLLKERASQFPVVALLGPRQSGKSTLVQEAFPHYTYVSLENPQTRQFALTDPEGFFHTHHTREGLIIDEAQYAPDLFSYIQLQVDASKKRGEFILTGSQNFLLHAHISQSLAGRVALLTLLPLALSELPSIPDAWENLLVQGSYPRIYAEKLPPTPWYTSYIETYVQKDIRQLKQVTDLNLFQTFLALCAGRIGQPINWSDLGRDCGISYNTAKAWASLLETSYILYFLPPYFKNHTKRLTKTKKLYFTDTGLASALLNIDSPKHLATHPLRGPLFENFIITEVLKTFYNQGKRPPLYYWRERSGHEIDLIVDRPTHPLSIEIKSGRTLNPDFFKGLTYWQKHAGTPPSSSFLIYGGEENQTRKNGRVQSWHSFSLPNS